MSVRREVAPATLPVELDEDGVTVEYLDGRRVTYEGPVEAAESPLRCGPGREVHVLVVDEGTGRGVMIYVNDRNTAGDILESTGVGRVILEPGGEDELVQGVIVRLDGYVVEVAADPAATVGRVFVFDENELGERAYELADG